MNKIDTLEAYEQVRHEFPLKGEIENYKEDIEVEKKDSIIKILLKKKELMKKKNMKTNYMSFTLLM